MSVLLIGANGQVGWEVLHQASQQGIDIIGLTRAQLDITNPKAIEQTIKGLRPSLVINAAAYTAVDKAEQELELAFAINRDAVAHLAAECHTHGIPFIHLSTDYVFDGNKGRPYTENDSANPVNLYGQSKLAGEQAVRNTMAHHIILRTSWVFGSHGNNFVKTILRLARTGGGPLRVVDDQTGAPTSAQSIAYCLLEMAKKYSDHGSLPWGTYHFSGKPHTSWYGFASEIIQQARHLNLIPSEVDIIPIPTSDFPTPVKRPANTALDTTYITNQLGCLPQDWRLDLQDILVGTKTKE